MVNIAKVSSPNLMARSYFNVKQEGAAFRHATFPEYPGIPEYELLKFHFPDLLKVLFWF